SFVQKLLRRFQEQALDMLKIDPAYRPRVTVLISWAENDLSDWQPFLKRLLWPAIWLKVNNDVCNGNKDLRNEGIDLQISLKALTENPDKIDKNSTGGGICYLDALPAAQPTVSREQAIACFRENYDLTLQAPV